MSIIPWRNKRGETESTDLAELSSFDQFRTEMERTFDRFLRDPWGMVSMPMTRLGAWAPSIDVTESDTEVTVQAEIPGVDPKELDISITGDMLTISGKKEASTERKGANYYCSERRFGSFQRSVRLPAGVDTEKVSAQHANGVVAITLKKQPGAMPKRITVKTADK